MESYGGEELKSCLLFVVMSYFWIRQGAFIGLKCHVNYTPWLRNKFSIIWRLFFIRTMKFKAKFVSCLPGKCFIHHDYLIIFHNMKAFFLIRTMKFKSKFASYLLGKSFIVNTCLELCIIWDNLDRDGWKHSNLPLWYIVVAYVQILINQYSWNMI